VGHRRNASCEPMYTLFPGFRLSDSLPPVRMLFFCATIGTGRLVFRCAASRAVASLPVRPARLSHAVFLEAAYGRPALGTRLRPLGTSPRSRSAPCAHRGVMRHTEWNARAFLLREPSHIPRPSRAAAASIAGRPRSRKTVDLVGGWAHPAVRSGDLELRCAGFVVGEPASRPARPSGQERAETLVAVRCGWPARQPWDARIDQLARA